MLGRKLNKFLYDFFSSLCKAEEESPAQSKGEVKMSAEGKKVERLITQRGRPEKGRRIARLC